jgi:hypothetical protein
MEFSPALPKTTLSFSGAVSSWCWIFLIRLVLDIYDCTHLDLDDVPVGEPVVVQELGHVVPHAVR